MLKYVNEQLRNYIPEQDLQEGILKPYAVPSNMRKPQQLTFYVKSLLEENHKNYQITNDSAIMKIQTKILSVIHIF